MISGFPTRILVATDGSEDAVLALQAASDLSNKSGSELHVVHAWQNTRPAFLPAAAVDEYSQAHKQRQEEAGKFLEEQAERLRSTGVNVAGVHLKGG
jgi:nucleotide-binding universal stress UspA family protein